MLPCISETSVTKEAQFEVRFCVMNWHLVSKCLFLHFGIILLLYALFLVRVIFTFYTRVVTLHRDIFSPLY